MTEWPRKIDLVPGSFSAEFMYHKRALVDVSLYGFSLLLIANCEQPEFPVMVTNTDLSPPKSESKGTASGYLFPDGKYFTDIPISRTDSFIKAHLLPEGKIEAEKQSLFSSVDMDHSLILICGHTARDARCGEIGPLLLSEFKAVLDKRELLYKEDKKCDQKHTYEVGICSHIGGHVVSILILIIIRGG